MGTNNLFGILFLFFITIGFVGCDNEKDDGFRGFMDIATITGDSINGYYCYMRGGGWAISYDRRLEGIERGYFAFNYMESDWKTTADGVMYINNAHVYPYSIYDVIHPIGIEEAESKHIIDKDSCFIPSRLSIGNGYCGYFDLHTGLSVINLVDLEQVPVKLNLVYDPEIQTPDTLLLQLCYNLKVPDGWSNTHLDSSSISCDISSFATLKQWRDSVTIVVEAGDKKKHKIKINKNDFFKPSI